MEDRIWRERTTPVGNDEIMVASALQKSSRKVINTSGAMEPKIEQRAFDKLRCSDVVKAESETWTSIVTYEVFAEIRDQKDTLWPP